MKNARDIIKSLTILPLAGSILRDTIPVNLPAEGYNFPLTTSGKPCLICIAKHLLWTDMCM
jgi:hypothetical protein